MSPEIIAAQLIDLKRQIEPLEKDYEKLADQLRAIGKADYQIPGKGKVTVTAASTPVLKGEAHELDQAVFKAQSPQVQANLIKKGIVTVKEIWSRAAKPSVKVEPAHIVVLREVA
jgi:hypothetical protein